MPKLKQDKEFIALVETVIIMTRHAKIIKNFGQSHLILSSFCLSGFY